MSSAPTPISALKDEISRQQYVERAITANIKRERVERRRCRRKIQDLQRRIANRQAEEAR